MASKLSLFLAELKRRKVYRVAAVYLAVGAAISLGVPDLFGAFGLPDAAAQFVILLIVIGFPIALVLAWAYEVRPEESRQASSDGADAAASTGSPASADPSLSRDVEQQERKSIAVLPFVDMSPEGDQEYFCDGMAEELINALTKVKGLRVAARTSSFHFKGKAEHVREIGRTLGVRSVLEGSVRRAEDRLRVTAQLVSAEDGYHLWSESYDRDLTDVFAIQDEISRSIVETLRPTLLGEWEGGSGEEKHKLVEAPTRNMEAYDHYLLGRHYWEGRYKEGLATALRHFEKAVKLDPEYALPHTGLADSYTVLGLYGYLRPEVAHSKATAAAARALDLDEGLSEAHGSLGFYEMFVGLDWEKGAFELEKAIELKPDNAKAHAWLGFLRCLQGRFQEAFDELYVAQRLDPLSPYITGLIAATHSYSGEPKTAVALLEEALGKDPDDLFLVWLLDAAYLHVDRYDEAMRMAERAEVLSGGAWHFKSSTALTHAWAGRADKAAEVRDELCAAADSVNVSPIWLAWIHMGLGEREEAILQLERAVAACVPYVFTLTQDPIFSSLWPDPRFRELASKVGTGVVSRAWERRES